MIVKNRNINYTDNNGKEKFEKDNLIFGVLATQEDINNYAGKQIDIHWHDQFELFVLDKGKAIVAVDGKNHLINQGEACYIGPNSLHGVKTVEGNECTYRSLVVQPNIVSGTPGSIFNIKTNKILQELNNYILLENNDANKTFFNNFDILWQAMEKEEIDYEFVVRNSLSNVFSFLNKMNDDKTINNSTNITVLKQTIIYVEENIYKQIRIEDIANDVHLSTRELQRIFKQNLNLSPMEYVRRKKILKSADELIGTDIPITELAYKYNFSSPAHYTLTFKKITGYKPNEYRNLNRY